MEKGDRKQPILRLREAFQMLQKIGRVEGLSMVGEVLGYLLLKVGDEQAVDVLRISQQAYQTLGQTEEVAQIQAWLDNPAAA